MDQLARNIAQRGIQESFGVMVNYLYDIETIETSHEAFVNDGTIMRSAEVDGLLASNISPRTRRLAEAQPRDPA